MTVTLERPMLQPSGDAWTLDDLERLPDDSRYEIVNGSLLVTPAPAKPHLRSTNLLRRTLERQAPSDLWIFTEGAGVQLPSGTMYVPDLVVVPEGAIESPPLLFTAAEARLVVEVLSPSNARTDRVHKRLDYADAWIAPYWILDPKTKRLTVLDKPEHGDYTEETVVKPGELWRTDRPFPLELDPAVL